MNRHPLCGSCLAGCLFLNISLRISFRLIFPPYIERLNDEGGGGSLWFGSGLGLGCMFVPFIHTFIWIPQGSSQSLF